MVSGPWPHVGDLMKRGVCLGCWECQSRCAVLLWAFSVVLGYVRPKTLLIIMMMMCYMEFETLLKQLPAFVRALTANSVLLGASLRMNAAPTWTS